MNENAHGGIRRLPGGWKSHLLLALLLVFPSTGFVQKYSGTPGVAAYAVLATLLVFLTLAATELITAWLNRRFRLLAGVAIAGLACGYVILHPFEDERGPGKSSDRDEGLEMAVHRLAGGMSPYYPSNRTAGPLSVLPGSMILAAPFVALGDSGYQNVFWLGALLCVTARKFKDGPRALWILVVPLALSPAAQYEFISGGDLLANGIFVALFLLFLLDSWSCPSTPGWQRWLACVALGVGIASRANFLLLMPLVGATMWRICGFKQAVTATMIVVLTASVITLPFYFHDPAGFTPLLTKQKLAFLDQSLPWASRIMMGTTIVAALCGAFMIHRTRSGNTVGSFFAWCTLITITPMVLAVVFASMIAGGPDFGFMRDRFGLMYVFFAILAWSHRNQPVTPNQCRGDSLLARGQATPVHPN